MVYKADLLPHGVITSSRQTVWQQTDTERQGIMAAAHGQGQGVHNAPQGAQSAHFPFLEFTKAPHILEMYWHNIRKRNRYKLDSLAGRHLEHLTD
eukprot:259805-Pelagomonas_calceolata.AAC.6